MSMCSPHASNNTVTLTRKHDDQQFLAGTEPLFMPLSPTEEGSRNRGTTRDPANQANQA